MAEAGTGTVPPVAPTVHAPHVSGQFLRAPARIVPVHMFGAALTACAHVISPIIAPQLAAIAVSLSAQTTGAMPVPVPTVDGVAEKEDA